MKRLHVAVRMDLRCSGIEAGDELPLFDRFEIFLSFDNDEFVCPDGIGEHLHVCV